MRHTKLFLSPLAAVALVMAAAQTCRADDDQDKEVKTLQGTWVLTKTITGGKEYPVQKGAKSTLTFKDQKVTLKTVTPAEKGSDSTKDTVRTLESDFTLDLSKKPKQITYALSGFKDPTANMYEIKGNTLKIVSLSGVEKPPSDFSGKDDKSAVDVYTKK